MCIPYNGVEYHHGLCVSKQTEAGLKRFDVLFTKHKENHPYRYSGICLNNDYQVCSNEYSKPAAWSELLEKIVGDTLASEKKSAELSAVLSEKSFSSYIKAKEKASDVYSDFCEKMKNALSLEEYRNIHENLKPILEKPMFNSGSNENKPIEQKKQLEEVFPDLSIRMIEAVYDCKDMLLTLIFVKSNETLKDCEIKYSRV